MLLDAYEFEERVACVFRMFSATRHDHLCLWAGAAWTIFVHGFLFIMFIDARKFPEESTERDLNALRVLCTIGLIVSFVPFIGWELEYGSAFSYFWPLHGVKRISKYTWRVGVFLKTVLLAHTVALIAAALTSLLPLDDEQQRSLFRLPLTSRLSYLDALLVPVCTAFPVAAMLIYTGVPNTSSEMKKPF